MNNNNHEGKSQFNKAEQIVNTVDNFYFITKDGGGVIFSFQKELPPPTKEKLISYREVLDNFINNYDTEINKYNNFREQQRQIEIEEIKRAEAQEPDGVIYLMESDGYYKIGRTINLDNRFGKIPKATDNPHPIVLVYSKEVRGYILAEEKLQAMFADFRVRGEWFKFTKKQVDEVISEINKM